MSRGVEADSSCLYTAAELLSQVGSISEMSRDPKVTPYCEMLEHPKVTSYGINETEMEGASEWRRAMGTLCTSSFSFMPHDYPCCCG